MNLARKIRDLQFVQDKIEAANFYLIDLEWLATELECPHAFPDGIEAKRKRAQDVLVGCLDTCICPISVADRAVRQEFRSVLPDEFYALERKWKDVSRRLHDAVFGMKPVA